MPAAAYFATQSCLQDLVYIVHSRLHCTQGLAHMTELQSMQHGSNLHLGCGAQTVFKLHKHLAGKRSLLPDSQLTERLFR